ncbi:hypothetical protein [Rossellomorea marisflavi]|uniref:hypothetical protein n=1 Tax=Rossellomorea marisflavi TaxID=189381 RepID=UPI0034589805
MVSCRHDPTWTHHPGYYPKEEATAVDPIYDLVDRGRHGVGCDQHQFGAMVDW